MTFAILVVIVTIFQIALSPISVNSFIAYS